MSRNREAIRRSALARQLGDNNPWPIERTADGREWMKRGIMAWTVPRRTMVREDAPVHHIALESQDEAVKRFFLSLPVDAQGSVLEMNGRAIACLVPLPAEQNGETAWTDAMNRRRCDLIDKEIEGALTAPEAAELHQLQTAMLRYRHRVAPLPLAAARQLHQELLERAGRANSNE